MAPALYPIVSGYHYISAYVLIAALLTRLNLLFFGRAAAHWKDLLPRRDRHTAIKEMLYFYLS